MLGRKVDPWYRSRWLSTKAGEYLTEDGRTELVGRLAPGDLVEEGVEDGGVDRGLSQRYLTGRIDPGPVVVAAELPDASCVGLVSCCGRITNDEACIS